jgi:hypothetical protein
VRVLVCCVLENEVTNPAILQLYFKLSINSPLHCTVRYITWYRKSPDTLKVINLHPATIMRQWNRHSTLISWRKTGNPVVTVTCQLKQKDNGRIYFTEHIHMDMTVVLPDPYLSWTSCWINQLWQYTASTWGITTKERIPASSLHNPGMWIASSRRQLRLSSTSTALTGRMASAQESHGSRPFTTWKNTGRLLWRRVCDSGSWAGLLEFSKKIALLSSKQWLSSDIKLTLHKPTPWSWSSLGGQHKKFSACYGT